MTIRLRSHQAVTSLAKAHC